MKTWMKIAGVTVVVALLTGLAVTAVAFAQTPAPPSSVVNGPARGDRPGFGPGPGPDWEFDALAPELMESLRQATDEATAEALGMTIDELEAAHEARQRIPDLAEEKGVDMADIQAAVDVARNAVLDQAVADGTLTQEEADVIKDHPGRGFGPGPGGEYGAFAPELMENLHQATDEATAEALGMTVDELEAAHKAGQRMSDLAEEKGVDMADIQAAVDAARDTVLDQAVADGMLTQEEADAIKDHAGRGFGPGHGGEFGALNSELMKSLHQATDEATAEALGMTVDELDAARQAGQRIPDLAKEKGVDIADIQAAMDAARDTVLKQAVADGTLTQEQADALSQPHMGGPDLRDHGRPAGE